MRDDYDNEQTAACLHETLLLSQEDGEDGSINRAERAEELHPRDEGGGERAT